MAKRSKLDRKGLTSLGLEKLIDILLDEAAANKALKARLQAALASASGPEEIARLFDKRLQTIEASRSELSPTKARDLAVELAGLSRSILGELADVAPISGAERILRFLGLRPRLSQRLYEDSPRLTKVFDEAEEAALKLITGLDEKSQTTLVPVLEKQRAGDQYGELGEFHLQVLLGLEDKPADAWARLLRAGLDVKSASRLSFEMLQRLAVKRSDVDTYIAIENRKPEEARDTFQIADLLYQAGRNEEALKYVRTPNKGFRFMRMGGLMVGVGPEYQARERSTLEADILDHLNRKDEARSLRWEAFSKTLSPEALRAHIAKLDDFAEFDEMDKALALVAESKDRLAALHFYISWPRLDLAAAYVEKHQKAWNGADYPVLSEAAAALQESYPLAATILFRVLLLDILNKGNSSAYPYGSGYLAALHALAGDIAGTPALESHDRFVAALLAKHGRKYGFWSQVPADVRMVAS